MIVYFIRHGITEGNLQKKYIGKTDEPLCEEGILQLQSQKYPECSMLFVSPMQRCIQTAEILYPRMPYTICEGFRECDFGLFENRNYLELSGNPYYQSWIDSGGTLPFPGGEAVDAFKSRCITAFDQTIRSCRETDTVSLIVHGGTIMAVLERYAVPKHSYYDYSIPNGECYTTEFDGNTITILEKL